MPVLRAPGREVDGGSHHAALARRADDLDQRGGGVPAVQSLQGEPDPRGSPIAGGPGAPPPAVPVLRPPPPASPRIVLPRLLAEVPRRGAVELLTPLFTLSSDYSPAGDQPRAIDRLADLVSGGGSHSVLLGITGSGKTFTLANVISRLQRPALVMSPNKTLPAQLYGEFKSFFPESAVEYFVSYYDYYQPEAYIPHSDTYIEKDALINDEIDRMRHSATTALFERRDVIIVASFSCIYGIGEPETYRGMHVGVETGQVVTRDTLIRSLVAVQYERNDVDFRRGTFRVRGDVVEIFPAAGETEALRVELWGDTVEKLSTLDPLRGVTTGSVPSA